MMAKRKLASEQTLALDLAAALARGGKPQEGVNAVVELLNATKTSTRVQNILDAASERGFICQYYPSNGGMSIRVGWSNKE
jgi:hypothetical protein